MNQQQTEKKYPSLIPNNGSLVVHDIHTNLNIEQPVASQHLAILRNAKLVVRKREGRFIYYVVNYEQLYFMVRIAQKLLAKK